MKLAPLGDLNKSLRTPRVRDRFVSSPSITAAVHTSQHFCVGRLASRLFAPSTNWGNVALAEVLGEHVGGTFVISGLHVLRLVTLLRIKC